MSEKEMSEEEKQFLLEMANIIWLKVKGIPIPDSYSEKDRLEILERYWTRAMNKEDY